MTIDAKRLQECLSILGMATSKNNTDKPLTKLIELSTEGGYLYGYTVSNINNLKMKICECDEEISSLVNFEMFSSIIKSCEGTITLTADDKAISIKSSTMKCKVPVYSTQNGKGVPHPSSARGGLDNDFSKISEALPICKNIIQSDFPIPCYRDVYLTESGIIVSDTDNVAIIDQVYFDTPVLLNMDTLYIISKLGKCKFEIEEKTRGELKYHKLIVSTDDIDLNAIAQDASDYDYQAYVDLFNDDYEATVTIDKSALSKAIGTSSLFKLEPTLVFNGKGVFLQIASSDFMYRISTEACKDYSYTKEYGVLDILKKILASKEDTITIGYGKDAEGKAGSIRCDAGNVKEIFSFGD